jgi:pentatricopeptide repeat protein
LLVKPFKEKRIVKSLAPCENGLDTAATFKHQTFPKFDLSLFYAPRQIENYNEEAGSLIKSLINNEQLSKMHDSEWARYLSEIVYVLWFQIFCTTLPMYSNHSKELIYFAKKLLDCINRKLSPMREVEQIYRRLFESCGTCRLQDEILELFNDMKRNKIEPDKITFCTYYQAFLISKKTNPILDKGPRAPAFQQKESYLKFTPEDFQKKLMEFESKQKAHEEEKTEAQNRISAGFFAHARSESDLAGDLLDTGIESQRTSVVKLSQVLHYSLYIELELNC